MIQLRGAEKAEIKKKVQRLPACFRSEKFPIILFQMLGTLILTFGICISTFKPIDEKVPNPSCTLLISCFFFLAQNVCAPFSGGHINPAVSVAFKLIGKNDCLVVYIISQLTGAVIGAAISFLFIDVIPAPYAERQLASSVIYDCLSQIAGTFIFIFFILYVTQTSYVPNVYGKYLILSLMLLVGRTFTFRKQCLNPAIAIAFQMFKAITEKDFFLFLPLSLSMVIGPIIGGVLATLFFTRVYEPLLIGITYKDPQHEEYEEEKKPQSQIVDLEGAKEQ